MSSPRIQIAVQDQALAVQITSSLNQSDFQLIDEADSTVDTRPDVLITDTAARTDGVRRTETAVLAVGSLETGNVILGDAFSDREITISCQLLGEIVQLKKAQQRATRERLALAQMARTDAVTGLANRHAWDEASKGVVNSGLECLAVAILDLDDFKHANDQQGYRVGDRILKTVGEALASNVREGDLVARIGGDEFGLLLPDLDEAIAATVVERIRSAVETALYDSGFQTTISAGSAAGNSEDLDELFERANADLHTAKRQTPR